MNKKYLTYKDIFTETRESVTNPATGFSFHRVFVTAFSPFPDQSIAGYPKAGAVNQLYEAFHTNKHKLGEKKCRPCVHLSQPATSIPVFNRFNETFLFFVFSRPFNQGRTEYIDCEKDW
jgi:hypothetical protein